MGLGRLGGKKQGFEADGIWAIPVDYNPHLATSESRLFRDLHLHFSRCSTSWFQCSTLAAPPRDLNAPPRDLTAPPRHLDFSFAHCSVLVISATSDRCLCHIRSTSPPPSMDVSATAFRRLCYHRFWSSEEFLVMKSTRIAKGLSFDCILVSLCHGAKSAVMKPGKWFKNLLTGKGRKEKEKCSNKSSASAVKGMVPSNSLPVPKEKKRWSFCRSRNARKDSNCSWTSRSRK